MSGNAMDLRLVQKRTEEGTRRTIYLDNLRNERHKSIEIFFEIVGEYDVPPLRLLDGFIFGIIFYAMQTGQTIRAHGTLSHDALRNINEFQEAWISWKEQHYKKVDIVPDEIVDRIDAIGEDEAIAAFSGGVDSVFTVLRHATGKLRLASYPLRNTVLMVHGFDVPLKKPEQFEALKARTAPLLQELDLKVQPIRTNLRELNLQDWQDSCLAQLACCLHNLTHRFNYGLVASSEPYNGLALPWGSNPATDHLLSGTAMRLVHDGAGYSRTQKVAQIAQNATATRVVKVCWEGAETFRNCGECEKCMRTRLNFLAVGVVNPACFDTPLDMHKIKKIKPRNDLQYKELKSIIVYARSKGLKQKWLRELERIVRRYRHPEKLQMYGPQIKRAWGMLKAGEWGHLAKKLLGKLRDLGG